MNGYADFELNLPGAIRAQLPPFLEKLPPAQLTLDNVNTIPSEAQGAYLLYLDDKLVYVGKSDAEAGLKARLERHYYKIQHRKNLDPRQVQFKSARIYSFSVMDVETILISFYEKLNGGSKPKWNTSGFGSNDPGKERDTQKPSEFNVAYPIDIDVQLGLAPLDLPKSCSIADALKWLRGQLPYTFRFEDSGHELKNANVGPDALFAKGATMRDILQKTCDSLPSGWQATVLSGYCILYKEKRDEYKQPTLVLRSK